MYILKRNKPVNKMRKIRGTSYVVAAAIMIVVAIALAVALYFVSQRFTSVGNWAQVQAYQVQNKFTAGQQIAIVGIRISSRANSPLYLRGILIRATPATGGAPALIQYTTSLTAAGTVALVMPTSIAGVAPVTSAYFDGVATIMPGQTVEISVTLTAGVSNPIGSVAFTIILADPSGTTQSFTTNEVTLT